MFNNQDNHKTSEHHFRIASLLSFVAGIVNVAGFLAVQRLTTNVTGHFAFLVDEVFKMEFHAGIVYLLFILFFFLGSFVSNFLIELVSKKNGRIVYILPILIESAILCCVAFWGQFLIEKEPDILAFCLLFAMGLQNSLVTTISKAAVRTTHLTGLFTDLGIEISQLFFYVDPQKKVELLKSIKLRFTIIAFFFVGGVISGVFYSTIGLYVLLIAAMILIYLTPQSRHYR